MDWDALDDVIRQKWKVLADAQSIPTQYDNDGSFTIPKDKNWVRFNIQPTTEFQADLGATKTARTIGLVIVQIFMPLVKGTDAGRKLAQLVRTEFKMQSANGVTWRTPFATNVGRVRDAWQYNVTCPFFSDDVES